MQLFSNLHIGTGVVITISNYLKVYNSVHIIVDIFGEASSGTNLLSTVWDGLSDMTYLWNLGCGIPTRGF